MYLRIYILNLCQSLTQLNFITYQPTINKSHATGTLDCYTLKNKISLALYLQVKSTIPKWTQIVSDLPKMPSSFMIKDANSDATVQYHSNGFIQSQGNGLPAGEYIFMV